MQWGKMRTFKLLSTDDSLWPNVRFSIPFLFSIATLEIADFSITNGSVGRGQVRVLLM